MGFPRQGYWSGLPFPSPGDPPDPGIEPKSPALASGFFTAEPPRKSFIAFTEGQTFRGPYSAILKVILRLYILNTLNQLAAIKLIS